MLEASISAEMKSHGRYLSGERNMPSRQGFCDVLNRNHSFDFNPFCRVVGLSNLTLVVKNRFRRPQTTISSNFEISVSSIDRYNSYLDLSLQFPYTPCVFSLLFFFSVLRCFIILEIVFYFSCCRFDHNLAFYHIRNQ